MNIALRSSSVSLPSAVADTVAQYARAALLDELDTWPKPGLVSYHDSGSHADMNAHTFKASAEALTPYFAELASAGAAGAGMDRLRVIGIHAETAMLAATDGINTHRGAIFALGLLAAAAGAAWDGLREDKMCWRASNLTDMVRRRWGEAIERGPIPLHSHGTAALLRYGAGGARAQAAAGFPHATEVGLPALRRIRGLLPDGEEACRVETFFTLLATLEDTNLLRRGGAIGLAFAREQAVAFLGEGGTTQTGWRERAASVHARFIQLNLSPGGCADLLAVTLFLDALETR